MNDNQVFCVSSKGDIWGNQINVVGEGIYGKTLGWEKNVPWLGKSETL